MERPECKFALSNSIDSNNERGAVACACTPDIMAKLCHCEALSNPWRRHQLPSPTRPAHKASLIAYIRLSPGRMARQEQEELIERYCAQHDFSVADTFVETGRPGLILQDAMHEMGEHQGLIAVDVDSFVEHTSDRMRDLRPFIHHFFCHQDKHLITIEEGIDTGCAAGQRAAIELTVINRDS